MHIIHLMRIINNLEIGSYLFIVKDCYTVVTKRMLECYFVSKLKLWHYYLIYKLSSNYVLWLTNAYCTNYCINHHLINLISKVSITILIIIFYLCIRTSNISIMNKLPRTGVRVFWTFGNFSLHSLGTRKFYIKILKRGTIWCRRNSYLLMTFACYN